ncbi:MAG: EutN/CcmL family microcompartment protein [Cyanobacteria bacterium P01_F01_bin.3]
MQIAKVLGTVVCTYKDDSLQGTKFLLCQLVDNEGQALPKYEVAADCVGAGVEEWVLISRGSAARQAVSQNGRPVDALVVGIIDTVSVAAGLLYNKREAHL